MVDDSGAPAGWEHTTLGAVGKYLNGRAFKKSEWSTIGRPIIRIQDLTGSSANPNYFEGDVEDRYVVRPGDFLISWSATLGAYIWDGPEGVLNQHIFKVESNIDKRFHYHLVRDRLRELARNAHGSGMVHVTKTIFDETSIAIPQAVEVQAQIAAAIDAAEARADVARSHLDRAGRAIKRFRRAVLAAAASGRLTEDWRSDQMADTEALLAKFLGLRAASSSRAARKQPEVPDADSLLDIPAAWTRATIDQLCPIVTDGEHQTPPRTKAGVPLLSARNVLNGSIVFEPVDHISEQTYDQLRRRIQLTAGDVLLTCSGTVGRSAVVEEGMRFALVRSVAVLRPALPVGEFLSLALRSPQLQDQINAKKTETAQANIFQGKIRTLTVPLPSLEEQAEIVRRAALLFRTADALGARIQTASRLIDKSADGVLAKAFRGEFRSNGTVDVAA